VNNSKYENAKSLKIRQTTKYSKHYNEDQKGLIIILFDQQNGVKPLRQQL